MTNTFSSEIAVNEFLNCQNDKLQDTSYHLELRDSTVVVCNSDNSIASRIALLPTNPKEYICLDGTIESHIMGTCFIHGKWLEPVEITGCMKKIDDLYKIWGMHRFPLIERKEEHVIKVVFSALALHIEAEKIYNFQAGWISDDELLIKNVLVSGDKIEYVENSAVKKGLQIEDMGLQEALNFIVETYFETIHDKVYSITMFLFLILGILFPKLAEHSDLLPALIIYFWGSSGTRKTTTVSEMMNPFGFLTASFEDSLAAVVELFRQTPLGNFFLDDLKKLTDEALKIFNKLLRLGGDATTQGYKMCGNKVMINDIKSLCVITGEVELKLSESSMARVLMLSYDHNTVNLKKLDELQANRSKLCTAVLKIIQQLMNADDCIDSLDRKVVANRRELALKFADKGIHGRYIDMMAWLISIYTVLEEYFLAAGVKLNFDYVSNIQKFIFNQHLAYQNSIVSVFARCIFEMYQSNALSVMTEEDFAAGRHPDIIDYSDEWFISSGVVHMKMVKYAESIGLSVEFSEKRIRAELFKAGILRQKNGKNTYELRKSRSRCSGYFIRKNKLFDFLEI